MPASSSSPILKGLILLAFVAGLGYGIGKLFSTSEKTPERAVAVPVVPSESNTVPQAQTAGGGMRPRPGCPPHLLGKIPRCM